MLDRSFILTKNSATHCTKKALIFKTNKAITVRQALSGTDCVPWRITSITGYIRKAMSDGRPR